MRILFAGSPSLAVHSLRKIARVSKVCAVLTAPDRPAGRGRGVRATAVKEAARSLGIDVLQPEMLDTGVAEEIRSLEPELLVVAAYGRIFKKEFLDLFPMGGINLHPSLLPRHRGPSPIPAVILAGDSETGVSIQKIALSLDTGDILAQRRIPLTGQETTGSLTDTLARMGADLLCSVLEEIAAGRTPVALRQTENLATYCPLVRKEAGLVDWNEPAELIERKVRAFDPWPRAWTTFQGKALLLLKTSVFPATVDQKDHERVEYRRGAASPGRVFAVDQRRGIMVRTARGTLAIERLQPEFGKPADFKAFLNGHPGIVGAQLGQ